MNDVWRRGVNLVELRDAELRRTISWQRATTTAVCCCCGCRVSADDESCADCRDFGRSLTAAAAVNYSRRRRRDDAMNYLDRCVTLRRATPPPAAHPLIRDRSEEIERTSRRQRTGRRSARNRFASSSVSSRSG